MHDLVTPDGKISAIESLTPYLYKATVEIRDVDPTFLGFSIAPQAINFNLRSVLGQLGVDSRLTSLVEIRGAFEVEIELHAYSSVAQSLLAKISPGAFIGKLFAADPRRLVDDQELLERWMLSYDLQGYPRLILTQDLFKNRVEFINKKNKVVAKIPLLEGVVEYDKIGIEGLIPSLAKGLAEPNFSARRWIRLHQRHDLAKARTLLKNKVLLLKTTPLSSETCFMQVDAEELPRGVKHLSSDLLMPHHHASGDIYEFVGDHQEPITSIPIKFFSVESHRTFSPVRPEPEIELSETAFLNQLFCLPENKQEALFIYALDQIEKGSPFLAIADSDIDQAAMLLCDSLKAMEVNRPGIFLFKALPSAALLSRLIDPALRPIIRSIYFRYPDLDCPHRGLSRIQVRLLHTLHQLNIEVAWLLSGQASPAFFTLHGRSLQPIFATRDRQSRWKDSTCWSLFGSAALVDPNFQAEFEAFLSQLEANRPSLTHPLFNGKTTSALLLGGNRGMMWAANRSALKVNWLRATQALGMEGEEESELFFGANDGLIQESHFSPDFSIFTVGGYGTDSELSLYIYRLLTTPPAIMTPALLWGPRSYWKQKLEGAFAVNKAYHTIERAQWVAATLFLVETGEEAATLLLRYFRGELPVPLNKILEDSKEPFLSLF